MPRSICADRARLAVRDEEAPSLGIERQAGGLGEAGRLPRRRPPGPRARPGEGHQQPPLQVEHPDLVRPGHGDEQQPPVVVQIVVRARLQRRPACGWGRKARSHGLDSSISGAFAPLAGGPEAPRLLPRAGDGADPPPVRAHPPDGVVLRVRDVDHAAAGVDGHPLGPVEAGRLRRAVTEPRLPSPTMWCTAPSRTARPITTRRWWLLSAMVMCPRPRSSTITLPGKASGPSLRRRLRRRRRPARSPGRRAAATRRRRTPPAGSRSSRPAARPRTPPRGAR